MLLLLLQLVALQFLTRWLGSRRVSELGLWGLWSRQPEWG